MAIETAGCWNQQAIDATEDIGRRIYRGTTYHEIIIILQVAV